MTGPAHQIAGDEEEYLAVTESILLRGSVAIARSVPGPDGQTRSVVTYSKFALGQSLLALPFVVAEFVARLLLPQQLGFIPEMILYALPALQSAAISALLFLLVRLLGRVVPDLQLSHRTAVILALLTGVATQLWPASRTFFADNSTAVLLFFSVYSLIRFRTEKIGTGWAIVAAWSAAWMVLCKTLFVIAVPALAAYGLWAAKQRQKEGQWIGHGKNFYLLVMTATPFLITSIVQLWHNELRYGSIWIFGYHQGRDGEFGFATPLLTGLYGIFFSSGRSFFLYSPLCLLVFCCARSFVKRAPAETALLAGVALPLLLAYAKWWSWHGGWEWGARFYLFLIPILLLISIPAWRWMDQPKTSNLARRMRQFALGGLIALSLVIQLLGVLIFPLAYWLMTYRELKVFDSPVYIKGVWEIRDDMLLPHFVPEFSPVAAHVWLAWATWNRERLEDSVLANRAPWVSLNPKWAPKNVRPFLGFDFWFLRQAPATGSNEKRSPVIAVIASAVLLALITLCLMRLRTERSRSTSPPP